MDEARGERGGRVRGRTLGGLGAAGSWGGRCGLGSKDEAGLA